MACFLVTHQVGADFSAEDWLAREKNVIAQLPREIKWLMSWYLPAQRQLVAHWDAPTAQAVRVALERAGICRALPILKIEPALELYPKRFAARRNASHMHHAHKKRTRKQQPARHCAREMSGAYAEAISSVLQTRAAAHMQ